MLFNYSDSKTKGQLVALFLLASVLLLNSCFSSAIPARLQLTNNNPFPKDELPQPVIEGHQEWIDLYYTAWEQAWQHIRYQEGTPQSPYMDEAFSDEYIWIWDTCFMVHFCKYAPNLFPGIESLNNFYEPIHDQTETEAKIHIIDNPPLFAWTEWEWYQMTGDKERLRKVVLEKQYLQKHYQWFNSLTEKITMANTGTVETWAIRREKGFLWEGGRSGMDNTPRGRKGKKAKSERPNNPDLLWIDAISQQALSALCISYIAAELDELELEEQWLSEYNKLKIIINKYYWDDKEQFYYDIDQTNLEKIKVMTPASYWALLAKVADENQAEQMHQKVLDPAKLGGKVPWVTVARDDADFNPKTGDYWRGAVWIPTAYMGIKSLGAYGYRQSARETSQAVIEQMSQTALQFQPSTIWECYNPNKPEPARHGKHYVRPDFCGWSALAPIALLIEDVLGFYEVDAAKRIVKWDLEKEQSEVQGIRKFRFGDIVADIIYRNGIVEVTTTGDFTLVVNGKEFALTKGTHLLEL